MIEIENSVLVKVKAEKAERGGEFLVPAEVTKIGDGAFHFCEYTTIVFPESVEEIGKAITGVNERGSCVKHMVFQGCPKKIANNSPISQDTKVMYVTVPVFGEYKRFYFPCLSTRTRRQRAVGALTHTKNGWEINYRQYSQVDELTPIDKMLWAICCLVEFEDTSVIPVVKKALAPGLKEWETWKVDLGITLENVICLHKNKCLTKVTKERLLLYARTLKIEDMCAYLETAKV